MIIWTKTCAFYQQERVHAHSLLIQFSTNQICGIKATQPQIVCEFISSKFQKGTTWWAIGNHCHENYVCVCVCVCWVGPRGTRTKEDDFVNDVGDEGLQLSLQSLSSCNVD